MGQVKVSACEQQTKNIWCSETKRLRMGKQTGREWGRKEKDKFHWTLLAVQCVWPMAACDLWSFSFVYDWRKSIDDRNTKDRIYYSKEKKSEWSRDNLLVDMLDMPIMANVEQRPHEMKKRRKRGGGGEKRRRERIDTNFFFLQRWCQINWNSFKKKISCREFNWLCPMQSVPRHLIGVNWSGKQVAIDNFGKARVARKIEFYSCSIVKLLD